MTKPKKAAAKKAAVRAEAAPAKAAERMSFGLGSGALSGLTQVTVPAGGSVQLDPGTGLSLYVQNLGQKHVNIEPQGVRVPPAQTATVPITSGVAVSAVTSYGAFGSPRDDGLIAYQVTGVQSTPFYAPGVPNQRGAWASSTAYAVGDYVINPTGDLVTPVVAFTSGGSYVAGNWNIVVPAQTQGKELAFAEQTANTFAPSTLTWTDLTGLTMTVPAGVPWVAKIWGVVEYIQGTAATDSRISFEARLVDSATATTIYAYGVCATVFPGTAQTLDLVMNVERRQAALGSSTAMKLQGRVNSLANVGNVGFGPADLGGAPPTFIQAIGR